MDHQESTNLVEAVHGLADQVVAINRSLGLIESRLMEIVNSIDSLANDICDD